jgi:hypothetical protein
MMKGIGCLIASVATFWAYSSPATACISCPSDVELTEASAVCLISRIDGFIKEAAQTDPVLVILDCDGELTSGSGPGRGPGNAGYPLPEIPNIQPANPSSTSGFDAEARPVYFILSHVQLNCLYKQLVELGDVAAYPINFDLRECQTTNLND